MRVRSEHLGRLGAAAAALAGAILLTLALAADALGFGGAPGLGARQQLMVAVGAAFAALGCFLGSEGRRARVHTWWRRTAAAPPIGLGSCLLLAAWFGLLTGFVEVAHAAVRKYGFDVVLRQPLDLVWMAPMAHLAVFLAAGSVLGLLARALPKLLKPPVAVFAFAFLACWSQSLVHPSLATPAVLLVSAGVALQAARIAARRASGFLRLARRSIGWMLGAVAALAVVVPICGRLLQSDGEGAVQQPAPGAPNVLLIVLDTVRADHMSFLGYGRATAANIERLAADGAVFERAYTTSPWTLPSHGTLFTGRHPHELSASWLTPLDASDPTLAELFRARGYATAGFAGNLSYCLAEQGLARGFAHYEDFYVEPIVVASSTALGRLLVQALTGRGDLVRNDAATVTDRFLSWLSERRGRPFFAFLNYFDAHAYYDPPPDFEDRFAPRAAHLFEWSYRDWSDAEMQGFVDAYDACIAFIDHHVGRLLDNLRDQNLLRNTLVIAVSDHGEQFGEHGLLDHANSLYHPLLHVPMVLSMPGRIPTGVRIEPPVSLCDLPATILGLTGLASPGDFPGHSLAPLWDRDAASGAAVCSPVLASVRKGINREAFVPVSRGDMASLIEGWTQLIVNGDGALELYDLRDDPRQERNLIVTEPGRALAARLAAALDRLMPR